MTEDEEDGEMEEGEVVIQDGEDAGEVSGEERNVIKADPMLWQQRNPRELAGKNRQRSPVDASTFSTRKGCSTSSGGQRTLMLRIYEAVSNWCCPRSVAPLCCALPMTFQWLDTSR